MNSWIAIRAHSSRICAVCLLLVLLILSSPVNAQSFPEPDRDRLLNGLKVLSWQRPGDGNVVLKLRVHSGAAFDLAGKGGTMSLLGDALFPDPTTREYVTEQLGGRLDVTTDYDSINVTLSGKADEFERMVELLRTALVATQLTPENVRKLRDARINQLRDQQTLASNAADQAIAARLFGNFPYGHPASGTVETVAKIERGDLILARERFLKADNSTLVVIGGIEKRRVMRALQQLLGPWLKSDRRVPATFRPPETPDSRVLVIDQPTAQNTEVRIAVRGLARADRDSASAAVLAVVMRERLISGLPGLSISVRHEAHSLPGMFIVRASVPGGSTAKLVSKARELMQSLVNAPPSGAEVERARAILLADSSSVTSEADSVAKAWLDVESYELTSPRSQLELFRIVAPTDIQRVAVRLFKNAPTASVVVGNYEQLKASLGPVELRREKPETKSVVDPATQIKRP